MACKTIKALPDFPTVVYVLTDSWYSSESIIKATYSRGFEYIGALKTNRVLYYPGGPKLGNKVKTYVRTLTKDDVHLVTVGKSKYWVHCFKGYIKKLPRNAKILISWPYDKLFEESAVHLFVSTKENPDTYVLKTYTCRWRIEVFFRDSKMLLDLDNYQVRSIGSIKRFLLLTMLSYCLSINENGSGSLSESRRASRKEIKQNLIAWVYEQATNGIPLSRINKNLGIA